MPLGLGGGHLWLILILLVIVLIIWGPGKLPDVGSGMGRAIREFKKATNDTKEQFVSAATGDDASTAASPPVPGAPHATPVPEEHKVSS